MTGILEGRVAIITGAGGGLGAAHARVFAAEGCAVIVNEINTEAAQAVVDDVTAAGGKAEINSSRGQSKEGKPVDARIINTTSGAGLQGSIGQSNYAAAKAGIAALTLNQAAELGRYNITANAVAPSARTGMTTAVPEMAERMAKPEDGSFDKFAPENVSNLLAWLASPAAADVSGRVFESEGGRICICDGWRTTDGVDRDAPWAPADIGAAMAELLGKEVSAQKVWGT